MRPFSSFYLLRFFIGSLPIGIPFFLRNDSIFMSNLTEHSIKISWSKEVCKIALCTKTIETHGLFTWTSGTFWLLIFLSKLRIYHLVEFTWRNAFVVVKVPPSIGIFEEVLLFLSESRVFIIWIEFHVLFNPISHPFVCVNVSIFSRKIKEESVKINWVKMVEHQLLENCFKWFTSCWWCWRCSRTVSRSFSKDSIAIITFILVVSVRSHLVIIPDALRFGFTWFSFLESFTFLQKQALLSTFLHCHGILTAMNSCGLTCLSTKLIPVFLNSEAFLHMSHSLCWSLCCSCITRSLGIHLVRCISSLMSQRLSRSNRIKQ